MSSLLDKMIAADVIVLATPVYFYTMDAQLKTLIDRTVDSLRGFTDCLPEFPWRHWRKKSRRYRPCWLISNEK